ncbi:MAG: DUF4124 domain-containing protein [Deltaproteobacteria bacterium]|nr:DUF4124 domain-containing protein [Deltaproteobacteria bacterium]
MRWGWLLICCLTSPAAVLAEWYEWRDASGTLHVANQVSNPAVVTNSFSRLEYGTKGRAVDGTAAAAPADAAAAAAAGSSPAHPSDDRRQRLEHRLRSNLAHLALLQAAPGGDAGRAELQNTLTDAVRADRAALAALAQDEPAP